MLWKTRRSFKTGWASFGGKRRRQKGESLETGRNVTCTSVPIKYTAVSKLVKREIQKIERKQRGSSQKRERETDI